jgi:4-diphosphocytidyl-2-C-methyl-D-erythritol kinase
LNSSAARGRNFPRNGTEGLPGIPGGDDGPADHEEVRAVADGIGGGGCAPLVGGGGPGGANPRRDNGNVRPAGCTQGSNFPRAGHKSPYTGRGSHLRKQNNLILRTAGRAGRGKLPGVHACQDGDSEQEHVAGLRCRRGHHGGASRQMDGGHRDTEGARRGHGFGHCVRDIVKFQVQENPETPVQRLPHNRRTRRREKAQADLHPHHLPLECIHQARGIVRGWHVQCHDDFLVGVAGHPDRIHPVQAAAHAKINLNLRVLGRRPDGYHEVETLMVPVGLHDEVGIVLRPEGGVTVTCDVPWLACDETNLAHVAARAFFRATGAGGGAQIHLVKRIPPGAGMGGGSGNAAAVLRGLDALCGTRLGGAKIGELAADIGSDVPWFLRSVPAVCRGRGEILKPVTLGGHPPVLLLKPPFGIATAWAYKAWAGVKPAAAAHDIGWTVVRNDLEAPVFRKYVLLAAMKEWIGGCEGVVAAGMSGSGSTIFAILDEGCDAAALGRQARCLFGQTLWVCPTRILAGP